MTGDNECYSVSGHAPPAAAEDRALTNETRGLPSVFVFFAALAFLLLTVPANHNEAEDAYFYAWMAESGRGAELFHRHHLLYLPLARSFWFAARALGLVARAFPALIGLSAITGAATVALVWRLFPRGGPLAALGLLFSYGFWRYSTTAEIYAPVVALSVASFFCATRTERHVAWAWAAIGCGTLALLVHLAAGPVVLLAIPVFHATQRRWRRAIVHAVVTATLVGAVYVAVLVGFGAVVYTDDSVIRPTGLGTHTVVSGLIAAGHTVLSGNFFFSYPPVRAKLEAMFPHHMLHEEFFMGQHASPIMPWVAAVTFSVAVLAIFTWWIVIMSRAVRRRSDIRIGYDALFIAAGTWLLGSALLALLFEATNPEMWVPALPPLWICIGVLTSSVGGSSRLGMGRLPLFALTALLAHNVAGGFTMIWCPESDYCRRKTDWLAKHAGPNDWVLTADSHSTVTYLQYHSKAVVLDGRFTGLSDWEVLLERHPPKNVWVLHEFFEPPSAILNRLNEFESRRKSLAAILAAHSIVVHREHDSVVYRVVNPYAVRDLNP